MVDQHTQDKQSRKDLVKKEEREQRILDAAAELLQKWGYRKTTLEDIARKAGVTKSSIYLFWKTREELFMALIEREEARVMVEIAQTMMTDPDGMTLFGMIKNSMLATLKNPLLKALVLQDTYFLGELITREYNTATYRAQMQGYIGLLEFLRERGLIRKDIDLRTQAVSVASVSWGFLLVDPLLPDEFKSSDEQIVEMVVTTLKRLLEPDSPPGEEERREGERAFKEYMQQNIAVAKQQRNETGPES